MGFVLASLEEGCSIANSLHTLLPKLQPGFADIKASCGELCNVSPESAKEFLHPGPYFDAVWKNFDCNQLFSHDFDGKVPKFRVPLTWKKLPYEAQRELNLRGIYAVDDSSGHSFDKGSFVNSTWTFQQVQTLRQRLRRGLPIGNYGPEADALIQRSLKSHMNITGQHVLVIGSENPWLEAMLLEAGAKKVTTLGKHLMEIAES